MTELNVTGLDEANTVNDIWSFNEVSPTGNAMGGTELMMKWLQENVSVELLDKYQIIQSRVRKLEDKPRVLWLHDTADDPESAHLANPESLDQFRRLVYVSNWQKQMYEWFHGIPPSKGVVLKNAIYPIEEHKKPGPKEPINIIYHTTPHRGLNVLLSAFDLISTKHTDVTLDVYSSFSIYGWDKKDEAFAPLFDYCNEHPQINYHGAVSNDEVREALKKAHIFAYPSIWPETSCISVLEAMSAKCVTVCPNYAALPETCANMAWTYDFHENHEIHAKLHANVLNAAIEHYWDSEVQNNLRFQKMYFDRFYSWEVRSQEWTNFLNSIMAQAPTMEPQTDRSAYADL